MRKSLFLFLFASLPLYAGCAMFMSWKSIPPPGGCDQCHTVPISSNWQVTYQAAYLTDERDRNYFQTSEYTMPQTSRPASSLDIRKVDELPCFECHKAPTPAHKGRIGRFHH
ncbi:cytochrome c [Geotalea uraniireducens]|uniref:Cytochrome c n=1 Tax=Geotalea uraniireducens TaxID=351604 RepID=A0ABM8ER54_9BACT|nr:cytochrome C [Geotalea uraniireducens]BDV44790.1 cytochrome c [Geotalea uraniireducens]